MDTVKVNKIRVLGHLRKNRAEHETTYKEAMEEWRKIAALELSKQLPAVKRTIADGKQPTLKFSAVPVSYLDSYDSAITKLEWSTQDEIELDMDRFREWVENKWSWGNQFAIGTTSYIAGKK